MKILNKLRATFSLINLLITILLLIPILYIMGKSNKKARYLWSKLQLKVLGVDLKIEGKIDNSADIYILNHQSLLDIILLESISKRDIAWVAKKEIAKLPLYGHILKAPNMIIVDRESKTGLVKLFKDVKNRLKSNRPVAIFPEGTRGDGKSLRKFRAGAKSIAQKLNLKVQPVVIINSREVLDSQKFSASSGEVKVIFLDSIDDFESNLQWYSDTHTKMQEVLDRNLGN
jgi:1-acyl-sn-glycerol-3-phosphate acyltransferase